MEPACSYETFLRSENPCIPLQVNFGNRGAPGQVACFKLLPVKLSTTFGKV